MDLVDLELSLLLLPALLVLIIVDMDVTLKELQNAMISLQVSLLVMNNLLVPTIKLGLVLPYLSALLSHVDLM